MCSSSIKAAKKSHRDDEYRANIFDPDYDEGHEVDESDDGSGDDDKQEIVAVNASKKGAKEVAPTATRGRGRGRGGAQTGSAGTRGGAQPQAPRGGGYAGSGTRGGRGRGSGDPQFSTFRGGRGGQYTQSPFKR